jgi:polypeptide N-acetylgalactosaminyltransferase
MKLYFESCQNRTVSWILYCIFVFNSSKWPNSSKTTVQRNESRPRDVRDKPVTMVTMVTNHRNGNLTPVATYYTKQLKDMFADILQDHERQSSDYHMYNVTHSDILPLERQVPDTRRDECKTLEYDVSRLPSVSVIIVFYNEVLSVLLRTVHSVLRMSPAALLTDIILVDDNSTLSYLGLDLEVYTKLLSNKITIIRNTAREGLIRSRMRGADAARGEVVVFVDAHVEMNVNWLEPLLEELSNGSSSIVQPIVDTISTDRLRYYGGNSGRVYRGGFGWDLR